MKEEQLIFIISQPRSGSTYLQSLISNHPKINTVSEPWVLLAFGNQFNPNLVRAAYNNELTQEAFNDYLLKYPTNNFKEKFKEFILSLYKPLGVGHLFVIDKTPRYWELLDEITEFFPNAKIIVLKRNPIDVAKSMVKVWGLTSFSQLNYYRRDLLIAPNKIQKYLERNKNNPNVYSLTYESLIENKKETTASIMEWLQLDFLKSQLETDKNIKIKGSFGDPYQNKKIQESLVKDKNEFLNSQQFSDFLNGYSFYLGRNYFNRNGFLTDNVTFKSTTMFQNFLNWKDIFEDDPNDLPSYEAIYTQNRNLKHSIDQLRSSRSFRLGRFLLKPFTWIK